MVKLFAKSTILQGGKSIAPKTVFEASPAEAKDLDRLKAARPATAEEIKAADAAHKRANGLA